MATTKAEALAALTIIAQRIDTLAADKVALQAQVATVTSRAEAAEADVSQIVTAITTLVSEISA